MGSRKPRTKPWGDSEVEERIKPPGDMRKISRVWCHGAGKINFVIKVQNGPFGI